MKDLTNELHFKLLNNGGFKKGFGIERIKAWMVERKGRRQEKNTHEFEKRDYGRIFNAD